MILILGALLALVLMAGVVLLVVGVRGRKVDSSILCRACAYDLRGLSSANRCPECGADISSWSALRVGRRKARRGWVVAGAVALASGAVPLSLLTVGAARHGLSSTRYRPTSWLQHDTRSQNEAAVDEALNELAKRQMAGRLSNTIIAALARQGLAYRNTGSPCGMWHRQYAVFLDAACAGGLLGRSEVDEYLLHGVGVSWTTEGAEDDPPGRVRVSIAWDPYWGASAPLDYETDFSADKYPRQPARFGPSPQRTSVVFYRSATDPPETLRFRIRLKDQASGETVGSEWDTSLVIPLAPGQHGGVGYRGRPAYTPIR